MTEAVAATPNRAIDRLKQGARARGLRIADESPDSLVVEFGAAAPRRDGIRGTALFVVRRTDEGSLVTMWKSPVSWDGGAARWIPSSGDLPSADELLAACAMGGEPPRSE